MGKLRQFDIVFEHPQGVFSAGKTLIGNVLVELSEPMKMRSRLFQILSSGLALSIVIQC